MKRRSSDQGLTHKGQETSAISKVAESVQSPKKDVSRRIPGSIWWLLFSETLIGFSYFQVMQDYFAEEYLAIMGKTNDETEWQIAMWVLPCRAIAVVLGLLADVLSAKRIIVGLVVLAAFIKSLQNAVNSIHFDYGLHSLSLLSIQGVQAAALFDQDQRNDLTPLYCLLRLVAFNFGCVMQIILYFLNAHYGAFDHGTVVSFFNLLTESLIFFIYVIFVKENNQPPLYLARARFKHSSRLAVLSSTTEGVKTKTSSSEILTVRQRLIYLLPLAFPTIVCGYAFIAYVLTFGVVVRRVVAPAPNGSPIELLWLWRPLTTILIATGTEKIFVPAVRRRNVNVTIRFRLGCSLIFWLAGHIAGMKAVSDLEMSLPPLPRHWSAQVRFVNFENFNVTIGAENSQASFTVGPNREHLVTFANLRGDIELAAITIKSQAADYVTHISIEKGHCVTYAIADHSELNRIEGHDPIYKGPPGTNYPYLARFYLANLDRAGQVVMTVIRWGSSWTLDVSVTPGKKKIFQLEPGNYTLSFDRSNIRQDVRVHPNSVQGIIYLSSSLDEFDSVRIVIIIPPVNLPIFIFAAVAVLLLTFSSTILMIGLELILARKSPETFRSFAFSVYFFVREPVLYGLLCLIRLFYNEKEDMFVAFLHGMLYLLLSMASLYCTTTKFGQYWTI